MKLIYIKRIHLGKIRVNKSSKYDHITFTETIILNLKLKHMESHQLISKKNNFRQLLMNDRSMKELFLEFLLFLSELDSPFPIFSENYIQHSALCLHIAFQNDSQGKYPYHETSNLNFYYTFIDNKNTYEFQSHDYATHKLQIDFREPKLVSDPALESL